jgi:hypothetical protein
VTRFFVIKFRAGEWKQSSLNAELAAAAASWASANGSLQATCSAPVSDTASNAACGRSISPSSLFGVSDINTVAVVALVR